MDELIKENIEISDINLLTSKGLYENNNLNSKYYQLYKNYKILLDKYLVNKLELDVYDQSIDDTGLKFMPVKKEDMDYYQYISAMNLKYIYLRNNLYVEKLSKENIDKILSLNINNLKKPSKDIIKIIEDTYIDVIDVNIDKNITSMVRYGPDNDNYWFPSNELVIGIRHDDFADNGLGEGKEWEENNNKQTMFLIALIDEIKAKSMNVIKAKVNVVWYNDYTIKEVVKIKKQGV